jgi:hypothetical protein
LEYESSSCFVVLRVLLMSRSPEFWGSSAAILPTGIAALVEYMMTDSR